MRLKFDNKYWKLLFKRFAGEQLFGEVDHKDQTITLNPDMADEGFALLNVAIHEFTHAEFPWLDEERVESASYNLARALWRMGARIYTYEVEEDA